MRKAIFFRVFMVVVVLWSLPVFGAGKDPMAWWRFDESGKDVTIESVSGCEDVINGNFKYVKGISGTALKFDGFSTKVVHTSSNTPELKDAFSIEAWVALGAYPWNWCPVVSHEKDEIAGYYFGIDSQGHVGLRLAAGGKWLECKSTDTAGHKTGLELRRWYHIAGVYDSASIRVYIDGKEAAVLPVKGGIEPAAGTELLIGRNHKKMPPTHPVRTWATYPSWYSFDGIIDEIKIYDRVLSEKEIAQTYSTHKPKTKPELSVRSFPTVGDAGLFGAFYTRLKYYDEWDALWRTGEHSDIVVNFDELPIKVMFWRGSRYSPCWVTENGKWMADQSRETGENWNAPRSRWEVPTGCCEHMSDAQCRFSHVRVIESTDARVVVHWRYALLDVLYRQSGVDPTTGWGYWGDEYYTIYPDGVGVRNVLPGTGGWQETIFFNAPGTKPEDNCELEAITLVNLKGQSRTYSWEHGYPEFDLPKPIIQMTNLKSEYRPFMIFRPGSGMEVFNVEVRPEYSHFPWWNHWPVAQVISDGRHAQAPDRAAHSSLAWGDPRDNVAIYGMTNKAAVSLVSLAKSWIHPAKVRNATGAVYNGYKPQERAYVLTRSTDDDYEPVVLELDASLDRPVVNPCFVIKKWGCRDAKIKLDGVEVERGSDFRYGHRRNAEGTDLIVWIKKESAKPAMLTISKLSN